MSDDPPVLGPFVLREPVGRGGMGVVWRATRRGRAEDAAIKVIPGDSDALLREVRTVARLAHPNVVTLLDTGRVSARVATQDLEAGALWVAMEFLPGRLQQVARGLDWPGTRRMAEEILRALAHAHARGVLHRDVKPGNVLRDRHGRWRLVDFGVASVRGTSAQIAGTRGFMAPELLAGGDGWVGPWTDLFALGRTLLAVCDDGSGLTRMPVPVGFPEWVARLASPRVEARFARAADALAELLALGPPVDRAAVDVVPEEATTGRSDTFVADTFLFDEAPEAPSPVEVPPTPRRARLPTTWDVAVPPAPPEAAGLELVALRTLPFVGRSAERSALWDELVRAEATGRPRTVALRGPEGSGRRRTARELAWHVEEHGLGCGLVVEGSWSEVALALVPAPSDRTLALRAIGRFLELPDDAERLGAHLDLRLADPALTDGEVASLVAELLARAAREQPVVVAVERGLPGLAALRARLSGPVVLVTAVDPGPCAFDRVVDVEPLSAQEARVLLSRAARLDPELAEGLVAEHRQPAELREVVVRNAPRAVERPSGWWWPPEEHERVRLSPEERQVLAYLASFGPFAEEPWLAEVCRREEVPFADALHEAIRAGRVTVVGRRLRVAPELRRELATWGDPQRRARACGRVLRDLGQKERAGRLLLEGEVPAEAVPLLRGARAAAWARGQGTEAIAITRLVVEALKASDPRAAAEEVTWVHFFQMNLESFEWADEARALLEEARASGWHEVVGGCLHNLSMADPAGGRALLVEAERAYEVGGRPNFQESAWMARTMRYEPDAVERFRAWKPRFFGESSRLASLARSLLRDGRTAEAAEIARAWGLEGRVDESTRVIVPVYLAVGLVAEARAAMAAMLAREIDDRGPTGRLLHRDLALAALLERRWSEAADRLVLVGEEGSRVATWGWAVLDAHHGDAAAFARRTLTPGGVVVLEQAVLIGRDLAPLAAEEWRAHGREDLAVRAEALAEAWRAWDGWTL